MAAKKQRVVRKKNSRWQEVQAFVMVAGGNLHHEIEPFLVTLRAFHNEPVFVYTDEPGYTVLLEVIRKHGLKNVNPRVVTVADLEGTTHRVVEVNKDGEAGDYWSKEWIWWKMEALRRSIVETGGKSCCLVDSDIVFTGRLDGRWWGEAVLSPFYWPHDKQPLIGDVGVFNAGMILTHLELLVQDWLAWYETGEGFFEQKCLENLQRYYIVDFFGSDFNFGKWRCRKPHSTVNTIHGHIHHKDHPFREIIQNAFEKSIPIAKRGGEQKVLFVASDPTGNQLFTRHGEKVASESGVQFLECETLGIERDWTEEELQLIAKGQLWGQGSNRAFLVSTSSPVGEKTIGEFQTNGWDIITCIQPSWAVVDELAKRMVETQKEQGFETLDEFQIQDGQSIQTLETAKRLVAIGSNMKLPWWVKKSKWAVKREDLPNTMFELFGVTTPEEPPGVPWGKFKNERDGFKLCQPPTPVIPIANNIANSTYYQ